jgi:hypothetical protein
MCDGRLHLDYRLVRVATGLERYSTFPSLLLLFNCVVCLEDNRPPWWHGRVVEVETGRLEGVAAKDGCDRVDLPTRVSVQAQ